MLVSHCNGTLDREEVRGNVLCFVETELLPLPQFLVDHLEAICVVPQLVVAVEIAKELPVDDNVLARFRLGQLAQFLLDF